VLKRKSPPTLYDVKCLLDKTIAGNDGEKLLAFTTLLTAYVKGKEQFLLLRGSTSVGKTYTLLKTIKLFPQEDVWYATTMSDMAVFYDKILPNCKIICASEMQKFSDVVKEYIKSMHSRDDKMVRAVYSAKDEKMKYMTVEPKTVAMTFAYEWLDEQLGTRCVTIDLPEDWKTNEKILEWLTENVENPFKNEVKNSEIERIRNHIRSIPVGHTVIIPFMGIFVKCLDRRYVRIRSDIDKHIALISALCLFNHSRRYKTEIDGKTYIFATPEDAYLAYSAFGEILSKTTSQLGDIHQILIDIAKEIDRGSINDYHKRLLGEKISMGRKQVEYKLESLVGLGLMNMEKDKGMKIYSYNENLAQAIEEVNWMDVFAYTDKQMKKLYPEYVDEYIMANQTIHPITGEDIQITKQKTLLVPKRLFEKRKKPKKKKGLEKFVGQPSQKVVVDKEAVDKTLEDLKTGKMTLGCIFQEKCAKSVKGCNQLSYALECSLREKFLEGEI
jgi:hypothetical protein